MSNKLNEGIVNWILQKAIGLVAGGDYRKAVKAFKGDKDLQKTVVNMAKNRQDFEKKLKARLKSDPKFKKNYQKNMSLFK
jgi:hypothetical protein